MPIRIPFWCGDSGFRGCILRRLFEAKGYQVIVPGSGPRRETGMLPKRGSQFSLADATRVFSENGLRELVAIDRKWNVSPRGRGDIDFAAVKEELVFIAEAKTRLIPRSLKLHGPRDTRLMLQYHLDEPIGAEEAWEKLVEKGVVRPPGTRSRRGGYDNPASIAELARTVAGFHTKYRHVYRYREIVVGIATMCYAAPFLDDIKKFLENTAIYLRRARLPVKPETALIVVYPDTLQGVPGKARAKCIGGACRDLGIVGDESIDPFTGCPEYRGCNKCQYREICVKYCNSSGG